MKMIPDIQRVFARHLRYSQDRDRQSREGLELLEAGDIEGAKRAYAKAKKFDLMRRMLQPDPNR